MGIGYVYILHGRRRISGRWVYYTGSTFRQLDVRMAEHLSGLSRYTKGMENIELIAYFEANSTHIRAIELHLKKNPVVVHHIVGYKTHLTSYLNFWRWVSAHFIDIKKLIVKGMEVVIPNAQS